jgi:hypothetical protein
MTREQLKTLREKNIKFCEEHGYTYNSNNRKSWEERRREKEYEKQTIDRFLASCCVLSSDGISYVADIITAWDVFIENKYWRTHYNKVIPQFVKKGFAKLFDWRSRKVYLLGFTIK